MKRIIPCLDVQAGRVVKGINFADLKDAGDPVELAAYYDQEGADELVLLDIGSTDNRAIIYDVVSRIAQRISIPFTVGGGLRNLEDIENTLKAGADKISISSAAVKTPNLIAEGAERFGSHCIVVAIDARKTGDQQWEVVINGGKTYVGLDVVEWARKVEILGAGEILLTSMDKDGTKDGYDIELIQAVSEAVKIPVIASGGAGNLEHLHQGIVDGGADAVLVASIFHYREYEVRKAKRYLMDRGVAVKL